MGRRSKGSTGRTISKAPNDKSRWEVACPEVEMRSGGPPGLAMLWIENVRRLCPNLVCGDAGLGCGRSGKHVGCGGPPQFATYPRPRQRRCALCCGSVLKQSGGTGWVRRTCRTIYSNRPVRVGPLRRRSKHLWFRLRRPFEQSQRWRAGAAVAQWQAGRGAGRWRGIDLQLC